MLWTQDNRSLLFKQNPTLSNATISKLLGQKWNQLSNKEKQIYKDKAEQIKMQHKVIYPNYIYTPKQKIRNTDKHELTKTLHSCKRKTTKILQLKHLKTEHYMNFTININNPYINYTFNKHKTNELIKHNIHNTNTMNFEINVIGNWLFYKEEYNYYEDIELFYSKL